MTDAASPGGAMRSACGPVIASTVDEHRDVITLGADGHALFLRVRERHPDRYVDVGISETNLVGVAAGLARIGWRPILGAMAPFLVRRAQEQLRLDVSLPGLPVVLIGVGGGLSYGGLGPSHHTVDDLALMSALPNMRIYCPADARDAAGVLRRCLPPTAPTYVRLTARQDPTVFESSGDAHTGHGVDGVRVLRDGPGVLVLATGRCVAEAVAAVTNTDAAVGVVSCLRPFPDEQVRTLAAGRPGVVTVSEALALAGLGERVATALGPGRPPLADLCVDHRYPPVASHEELLTFYGVDRTAIRRAIDRLSRRETP